MGRIIIAVGVIAIGLSGLLVACGQQAQPTGEGGGASGQQLDYIDAVPIDENAPALVAEPQIAAKKEEPKEDREEAEKADTESAVEVAPAPARTPPEPAASETAAAATRRANETTATPYEATPRPD